MRIAICGFYGWNNCGDEGILLAIIDSLGKENEYVVCTNLPYTLHADYLRRHIDVSEVRHIYDTARVDYDVFLLGGGGLSWGFGWRQALAAFAADKPCVNYAVSYTSQLYHPKLKSLYRNFLIQFDLITVRDLASQRLLLDLDVASALTMCPSINLQEEKFDDCPKNMIAVCPRYEDGSSYEANNPQIAWLVTHLQDCGDEVLLIPFAPRNLEGAEVDLALCRDIAKQLRNKPMILDVDGNPRKVKYALSQSKHVLSGGRYHALVWAVAHKIPFDICPTAKKYPKIPAFIEMCFEFGSEKLREMEKQNKKFLGDVLGHGKAL